MRVDSKHRMTVRDAVGSVMQRRSGYQQQCKKHGNDARARERVGSGLESNPEMIGNSVAGPHRGEPEWQGQERITQPMEQFVHRQREERCLCGVQALLQSDNGKHDD